MLTEGLRLCVCVCASSHNRLSKVLQQPGDEPVAVRLMAFAAAVVPVVVASGLAYKHASGSSLNYSLYKVSGTHTARPHA